MLIMLLLPLFIDMQLSTSPAVSFYPYNLIYIHCPPVTSRACPVMYDDAGDAKNSIALETSTVVPIRRIGTCHYDDAS